MTQTGGTLTQLGNAAGEYYVGAYGTGTYNMSGGLWSNAPWVAVGYGGASYWAAITSGSIGIPAVGTMNQTGGTIQGNASNGDVDLGGGYDNGSTAVWNLSGSGRPEHPVAFLRRDRRHVQ